MRIAITGGTGFVGRHLAPALTAGGHEVVLIARGVDNRDVATRSRPGVTVIAAGVNNQEALTRALAGCDAVAHCAGINRELGDQTYQRVHVDGTAAVVGAARVAGVDKIVLLSFLRARPACGSPYHESKWAAEAIVRDSGLDYTVIKAGMTYGCGDHMLDHVSHALFTFPIFPLVGRERLARPLAVEDLQRVLTAALTQGRLSRQTVAVTGPEELRLSEVIQRVGDVIGKPRPMTRLPAAAHYMMARVFEWTMVIPLVATAQVRILTEGMTEALPSADALPDDLQPRLALTPEQIKSGLPEPGRFGLRDLRFCQAGKRCQVP
jgi:NADH dehydrogenase